MMIYIARSSFKQYSSRCPDQQVSLMAFLCIHKAR